MLIIFQRNCVSLKYTIAEDNIKLIPIQKMIVHIILKGNSSIAFVIFTDVTNTIIISGTIEINRFIADDKTLDTGNIYLGIYTFVINDEFPTIAIRPCWNLAKKLKIHTD